LYEYGACGGYRNYTPSLEEYFETAIEQADPEGGIEEQYKYVS